MCAVSVTNSLPQSKTQVMHLYSQACQPSFITSAVIHQYCVDKNTKQIIRTVAAQVSLMLNDHAGSCGLSWSLNTGHQLLEGDQLWLMRTEKTHPQGGAGERSTDRHWQVENKGWRGSQSQPHMMTALEMKERRNTDVLQTSVFF